MSTFPDTLTIQAVSGGNPLTITLPATPNVSWEVLSVVAQVSFFSSTAATTAVEQALINGAIYALDNGDAATGQLGKASADFTGSLLFPPNTAVTIQNSITAAGAGWSGTWILTVVARPR